MYHYFQHIPKHTDAFNYIQISYHGRIWALAFATIHNHPFPLPHYYRISNLPSVALVAQTIGWIVQSSQWNNCCARLKCHVEESHLMSGHLGHCRNSWEGFNSTTRKWKLLFMNGCTVDRPTEFLSSCEDRTNALHLLLRWLISFLWPSQQYILNIPHIME